MFHPHSNAIINQCNKTPLRSYFPIKHATSIFPISIQTNEMISVIKNTDIWWIDGIEIPSGFNWSDLIKFQLTIGGSIICNIPIKPILEMLPETIKGNFWRFPFHKLFEQAIQLYALQYHEVKYKFESTTDFEIKIYQGTSFLDNEMRNNLECKTIKIRNITQPFLFHGKSLELDKQVNLISTGFLFHTHDELHKIKVSLNNNSLLEYNEIMIDIYAKKLSKINYNKKHQKELKCVLNKYQVPIDILEVIENNIKNDYWYWIPFAPAEDLWKWDFTDLSINMNTVENLKIEVEPAQKSSNLYFITYNILNIIHGMAGLKFAY